MKSSNMPIVLLSVVLIVVLVTLFVSANTTSSVTAQGGIAAAHGHTSSQASATGNVPGERTSDMNASSAASNLGGNTAAAGSAATGASSMASTLPGASAGSTAGADGGFREYSYSCSTQPTEAAGDGYTQQITFGTHVFNLFDKSTGSYRDIGYNSYNQSIEGVIANRGCGPAAVATVLTGYGESVDPGVIGLQCLENEIPSSVSSLTSVAARYGLQSACHEYHPDDAKVKSAIRNALLAGRQVLVYVGRGGEENAWYNLTHSGSHWVVILAIDKDADRVFVANSSLPSNWYDLGLVVRARGISDWYGSWGELYK